MNAADPAPPPPKLRGVYVHVGVCGLCMYFQPQCRWGRSGWGGGRGFAYRLWHQGEERCLCKQLLSAQAA